ncbi:small integral membrane protein 26-like [Engraulis encrasicolus]|uniref:small integral membrane protein 26-like n=1 Tax=Engraulis encrasicolus TaxID=184585 RepID=UPI002FD01494
MLPGDALRWNKRASIVYALGAWSLFGSLVYYKYSHKDDPEVKMEPVEEEEKPNVKNYKSTYNDTRVVYKEGFVPYSTRVMNFITGSKPAAAEAAKDSEEFKSD